MRQAIKPHITLSAEINSFKLALRLRSGRPLHVGRFLSQPGDFVGVDLDAGITEQAVNVG
jgi:hypothetical protein